VTEWHIEWCFADEGPLDYRWRPHYRCTGLEAAEVAIAELREHHSSKTRRYRLVEATFSRKVVG
jgi:hypothetical protein